MEGTYVQEEEDVWYQKEKLFRVSWILCFWSVEKNNQEIGKQAWIGLIWIESAECVFFFVTQFLREEEAVAYGDEDASKKCSVEFGSILGFF